MKNENELKAITTVYSYRFPEVRDIISKLSAEFPHDVFMQSLEPVGGLDDFHEPVIQNLIEFYKDQTPGLELFPNSYPTQGSEEGIREIMTELQTKGTKEIYTFKGEYEGYLEVAKTRGINTTQLPIDIDPKTIPKRHWFISNPSAINGNIISNDRITEIADAGHQIFYDLAYLGSTKEHEFDLNHENIFAAVVSMSKPYGMFYDRVGFAFSKEPVNALYGNKWFKGIFGLMAADEIFKQLTPTQLYDKYRPVQEGIVLKINQTHDLELKPSDALLLANMDLTKANPENSSALQQFRRNNNYRLCLSKYYLEKDEEFNK